MSEFHPALWTAGFPEQEAAVVSGATTDGSWVEITGLPNRLQSGRIRLREHGDGNLQITAAGDVDARTAAINVEGVAAAAATFANGVLTVTVATTANLGAIKDAVDGISGTPFNTAFVGGASENDALLPGTLNYTFAPRVEAKPLMCELTASGAAFVFRGRANPSGDTGNYVAGPAEPLRFELSAAQHDVRIKRIGSTDVSYSLRAWVRV